MNTRRWLIIITSIASWMAAGVSCHAGTVHFSGYTWEIRPPGQGGPGPNNWNPRNVWVDKQGSLHLKLAQRDGQWSCAELYTQKSLGFGSYQFWLSGRVDQLDQNVVFGLFNYPEPEMGPDKTHEIDIEFARWGDPSLKNGNYTVWPTETRRSETEKTFEFKLSGNDSTHRFIWSSSSIHFQSLNGHSNDDGGQFTRWLFQPEAPVTVISQHAMPFHINLWCYEGHPPKNGRPVELVVRSFKFTPR